MTWAATLQEHKGHDLDTSAAQQQQQQQQQQQAVAEVSDPATAPPDVRASYTPSLGSDVSLEQLLDAEPGLQSDSFVMQAAAHNKAFAELSTGASQAGESAPVFETEECVVCWAAEASIIFEPCGHMCTCEACSQVFTSSAALCPMCRADVRSTIAIAA